MDDYPEILPPREDGVFKRILTHPSGKPVLLSVVSGLLGVNVTEATVLNVEPVLTGIDEKREKFDVNCKTDTGHQMEIEMQAEAMRNDSIANLHKNMLSRSVFNLCDLHKSQPGRGKAYDTLLHSYQATICGYTLLPSRPSYINRVQLRFDDGQLFVEDVGIIFLELTKLEDVLKKPVDEMSLIEAIAVFFAKADDLRYRSMITALGRVREEIGLADELLLTISKDDIERAHYRSRRLFEMDRQSEIALATRVGEQRGEQRGIHIGEQRGINIGEQRGMQIGEQIGEQRGMQIGEQIGEQRGIQVGRIAAAIDAIRAGITSPTAIAAIAGITEDQAVSLIQEHKQNP